MRWTAWSNGTDSKSGAGFGFKVGGADADHHFAHATPTVRIDLPTDSGVLVATANIRKDSFRKGSCQELISKDVGRWLHSQGYAPWLKGKPPVFLVTVTSDGTFVVNIPPLRTSTRRGS